MSKEYLNEDDLIRRGDVIAAFGNLEYPDDDLDAKLRFNIDTKCRFAGAVFTVPPADEKTAVGAEIVLDFTTAKKKMELAEKILELDRKIARLDKSIQEIGDDENKTCSMVINCDCVIPFTDIDVEEVKSMLRNYRDNLHVKLRTLWKEFATINPWKTKEEKE